MAKTNRKLGLYTSTSLVVGNMIGAGIFLMPATLATYGTVGIAGWLCAATGAILLAKIFSNLSKIMPLANGGPYAYSREGLGNFAGFIVAWGYWISVWCTNAAIAVSLVSALSTFFPVLATSSIAAIGTGLSAIWLLTYINTLGIITSGIVQLFTTILKIIPLLAVGIAGIFFINRHNFPAFNTSHTTTFSALTNTTALTFFAFLGMECATIPAANVANPTVTIPKATMLGTLLTTFIYILCSVVMMGIIPADTLSHSVTPLADAAVIIFGPYAGYMVSAGATIAAFGALNGWILIQGQVPAAIAADKLFPAIFKQQNKKGVPATGIIIGSILVSVVMTMNYTKSLADQFKFLILLTTLTVLVPYLLSSTAYVILELKQKKHPPAKTFKIMLHGLLAFTFSLWAVAGSGEEVVYWGFILLMAGIPFYAWIIIQQNKKL